MKKIISENIKLVLVSLITGIICVSGTVLAENLISANQIGYNNTTVADQLDSLYQTMFSNNYSTTEKRVGKWIDNKPLYQKTINCGVLNSAEKQVQHNISGIDAVVNLYGIYTLGNEHLPLPYSSHASAVWNIRLSENNGYIVLSTGSEMPLNGTVTATIQYTKKGDSPIVDE